MDIVTLIGLALSAAALVPIFTQNNVKLKVFEVFVALSLIGVFSYQAWESYVYRRGIDDVESRINVMLSSNHPMSFEQIYTELDYIDYSKVAKAIDDLVDSQRIHSSPVEVTSAAGTKYTVRVYNNINFPIR